MATPRKRYFRVSDAVLHKPWTSEQLGAFVRLLAYLNTRWAREGLTPQEACEAEIPIAALMLITGKRRADIARKFAGSLADIAEISAEHRGDITWIRVHNYAEYQELRAPETPPPRPIPRPAPYPAPQVRGAPADGEEQTPSLPLGPEALTEADRALELLVAEGERSLTRKRIAALLDIRPAGRKRSPEDFAAWYLAKAPKMRAAGRRNLYRTAVEWWSRATGEEIRAAHADREGRRVQAASAAWEARQPEGIDAAEAPTEPFGVVLGAGAPDDDDEALF